MSGRLLVSKTGLRSSFPENMSGVIRVGNVSVVLYGQVIGSFGVLLPGVRSPDALSAAGVETEVSVILDFQGERSLVVF